MPDVLVDSDVFVDHLRGARRLEVGEDTIHYSVLTRAELFAGRATDEPPVSTLLASFRELPLDRAIAERAGRLRRETGMAIADAVIAATALEHGCELATRNVRDFQGVADLVIRPPR